LPDHRWPILLADLTCRSYRPISLTEYVPQSFLFQIVGKLLPVEGATRLAGVNQEPVALDQRWPLGDWAQQNSFGGLRRLEGRTRSQTKPLAQWFRQNHPARFVETKLHAIYFTMWQNKWHHKQKECEDARALG
jgi:hypothetical protein